MKMGLESEVLRYCLWYILASYPGRNFLRGVCRKRKGPGINCMHMYLINHANLACNHSVVYIHVI